MAIVTNEKFISKKLPKDKVRWKRVFRPIEIFGRKWSFWFVISGGIAVLLRLLFEMTVFTEDIHDNVLYTVFGIWVLSVLLSIVLLFILPIIWIVRLLEEIRWKDRFSRCE